MSTARDLTGPLTEGDSPCRAGNPNRPVAEQLRRLGCLTPHNQRIVARMPQHGVQGCRRPRTILLAFGDSAQVDGLALMRRWTRILWPTLPESSPKRMQSSGLPQPQAIMRTERIRQDVVVAPLLSLNAL